MIASALLAAGCWFVDGFHGGVYGHYPRETYTKYICDQLDHHPDWAIGLEIEPVTWDVIAGLRPDDLKRLQEHAKTPRVEFTNPTYAQPYLWNISGESILRQFELGTEALRRHFPEAELVTYACEEPCFTSCLPAVLKGYGYKYAVLRCPNTCWGGYPAAFGGERVRMIGPDGTAIDAVPRPACEGLEPGSVWQTTSWGNGRAYLDACRAAGIAHPVGMTYQDAGWTNGPWGGENGACRRDCRYVTWRQYFEEVSDPASGADWRFSQEDVMPNLMWGSSVMNEIGRQVRSAENLLVQSEKVAALARLAAGRAANSLDEGWRNLCLAQHHDSWIVPYNGLHQKDMTWAKWIRIWTDKAKEASAEEREGSLEAIARQLEPSVEPRLLVVNTQGHARRELALFPAREGEAPFVFLADVPSFGYRAYTRTEALAGVPKDLPTATTRADGCIRICNGPLAFTLDPSRGGALVEMTSGARTLVAAPKTVRLDVMPTESNCLFGELRGHFYDEEAWRSSCEAPATCAVSGAGTPTVTATVQGMIADSPFTIAYRVSAGSPVIDGRLRIDWKGTPGIGEFRQRGRDSRDPRRGFSDDRYKLNLLLPTTLAEAKLWKDAPFDVCASRLDHTWFGDWRDIRHNIILNWVDVSEGEGGMGLAAYTDHTGSYSFGPGFPLALTVQYVGAGLWGRDYPIEGPTEMSFALRPHAGCWDAAGVDRTARDRAEPLLTRLVTPGTAKGRGAAHASWLSIGGTGCELSAAIPMTDGSYRIRLDNSSGDSKPRTLVFSGRSESVAVPRHGFLTLERK